MLYGQETKVPDVMRIKLVIVRQQGNTMSTRNIEELLSPYEGQNGAHKSFRQEFKYLNALYYLIVSAKDVLRQDLQRTMKEAEVLSALHGKDGKYAFGMVTHPISTTQCQFISVAEPEARTMVQNFDGFIDLLGRHCVIAAHRAIMNFANNLLLELDLGSLISISPLVRKTLQRRRLRPAELAKQFEKIGEPIHNETNGTRPLQLLGETRNLLEHNNGKVTERYRRLVADASFSVGNPVRITSKEVGEAFALVESTAASLNQRVIKRFKL